MRDSCNVTGLNYDRQEYNYQRTIIRNGSLRPGSGGINSSARLRRCARGLEEDGYFIP